MSKEDDSDELDPRVQDELESLNVCTDEINRLEIQLDEANAQFRSALSDSTQRLKNLSSKLGKCIEQARPYYEAVEMAKKAQLECQKAAVQFQRAASLHATAKHTIAIAEQKFLNKQGEWQFDSAWQEMLNHATAKVMEADQQRMKSELEHRQRADFFARAEHTVKTLEQKLKSAITKSKPYFETKDIFQRELQILKERVQGLQKAVVEAKKRYTQALRNLEVISEQIHQKRKLRTMQPREPGVGAEKLELTNLCTEPGDTLYTSDMLAEKCFSDSLHDSFEKCVCASSGEREEHCYCSTAFCKTCHSSSSSLGYHSFANSNESELNVESSTVLSSNHSASDLSLENDDLNRMDSGQ